MIWDECPVLWTRDNLRNSTYPWNKKQQHFINTKSLIILGINLTRHESCYNLRINSERQKWLLRKTSHLTKMTICGNRQRCMWIHFQQGVQNCFDIVPICQTFNIFGQVQFSTLFRDSLTAPFIIVNSILIATTVCRIASDKHFCFFTIFLLIYKIHYR